MIEINQGRHIGFFLVMIGTVLFADFVFLGFFNHSEAEVIFGIFLNIAGLIVLAQSSFSSPFETIINTAKQLESFLESKGATGKGLHEKLNSIENQFTAEEIRAIRRVATIRNKTVHEVGYTPTFDDVTRVEDSAHKVMGVNTPWRSSSRQYSSSPSWRSEDSDRALGSRFSSESMTVVPELGEIGSLIKATEEKNKAQKEESEEYIRSYTVVPELGEIGSLIKATEEWNKAKEEARERERQRRSSSWGDDSWRSEDSNRALGSRFSSVFMDDDDF